MLVNYRIYNCNGSKIIASGVYAEKIKMARKLFTKPINFPEPEYYIKLTQCHNAWANIDKSIVIIAEPIVKDYSPKELAGILGHELAHIQEHLQKGKPSEHWKIDVMGADLTNKDIITTKINRILKECENIFENNKLLMYVFPLSYLEHALTRYDFLFRLEMVNSHVK